jgi:hypothetical protein
MPTVLLVLMLVSKLYICAGYAYMTGGRMMGRNAGEGQPADMQALEKVRAFEWFSAGSQNQLLSEHATVGLLFQHMANGLTTTATAVVVQRAAAAMLAPDS